MRIPKQVSLTKSLALTISLVLLVSGIVYVLAAAPSSTFWLAPGVYPGAPSFTVWREGNNYFAKNANGELAFSGTNASQIFQGIFDAEALAERPGSIFAKAGIYLFDTVLTLGNGAILTGEHPSFGADSGVMDYGTQLIKSGDMDADSPLLNVTGSYVRLSNIQVTSQQAYSTLIQISGSFGYFDNVFCGGRVLLVSSAGYSVIQNSFNHVKFQGLTMMGTPGGSVADNRFFDLQLIWSKTTSDHALIQDQADANSFYAMRINCPSSSIIHVNLTKSDRNVYSDVYFDGVGTGIVDVWLDAESYDNTFIIANSESSAGEVTFIDNGYGNLYIDRGYLTLTHHTHPTTTSWGDMEQGRIWFCTTHNATEYWNGTAIITP